jgi:hypothetical protein
LVFSLRISREVLACIMKRLIGFAQRINHNEQVQKLRLMFPT